MSFLSLDVLFLYSYTCMYVYGCFLPITNLTGNRSVLLVHLSQKNLTSDLSSVHKIFVWQHIPWPLRMMYYELLSFVLFECLNKLTLCSAGSTQNVFYFFPACYCLQHHSALSHQPLSTPTELLPASLSTIITIALRVNKIINHPSLH